MKCPLREVGVHDEEGKFYYESADCLKEECAWWIEGDQCCAVTNLARDGYLLLLELKDIKEKMPQDERTRRKA